MRFVILISAMMLVEAILHPLELKDLYSTGAILIMDIIVIVAFIADIIDFLTRER